MSSWSLSWRHNMMHLPSGHCRRLDPPEASVMDAVGDPGSNRLGGLVDGSLWQSDSPWLRCNLTCKVPMTVQLQLLRAGVGPMLSCSTVAEWRRNRLQCSWCQSSRGPTWQRMESISAISSKGSVWAWTTRCYRWNMLTYGTQHSLRALTAKVRGTILSRNGRPNWLWDSRWQLLSMQILIDRKFTSTTQWNSCLRYIATSRIHVYARTCITVQHSPVQSSTAQHSPVQRRAQHTAQYSPVYTFIQNTHFPWNCLSSISCLENTESHHCVQVLHRCLLSGFAKVWNSDRWHSDASLFYHET